VVRSIEDVKAIVSAAFVNTAPPRDTEIAEAADWDADAITRDFAPWLDRPVPASVLEQHAKSLPALTPKAFAFFLKDYLLYSLDHLNSELTEYLIYRISSVEHDNPYWAARLELLSPTQREAIASYCDLLKERLSPVEGVLHEQLGEASRAWSS
jgi:hypothetical protein